MVPPCAGDPVHGRERVATELGRPRASGQSLRVTLDTLVVGGLPAEAPQPLKIMDIALADPAFGALVESGLDGEPLLQYRKDLGLWQVGFLVRGPRLVVALVDPSARTVVAIIDRPWIKGEDAAVDSQWPAVSRRVRPTDPALPGGRRMHLGPVGSSPFTWTAQMSRACTWQDPQAPISAPCPSPGPQRGSPPPLTQPLPRVAARAEDARPRRQRLATEDERHRMVGRELAGSDRVRLAMPARTGPAVACDVGLHRPLRQSSPGAGPPYRVVGRAPEAVGEARPPAAVAASLVRRGPAAGAGVVLAAPTGADA